MGHLIGVSKSTWKYGDLKEVRPDGELMEVVGIAVKI